MGTWHDIARGRHYFTDDPKNIPRIFTSATLVVGRDLLVEKTVTPRLAYPGEILEGFDAGALPPLEGYQRIFPKPAAQVLLQADEELAQFGPDGEFGEMAALSTKPRVADAIALEDTVCYTLAGDDFRELLRAEPELAIDLAATFAKRLAPA